MLFPDAILLSHFEIPPLKNNFFFKFFMITMTLGRPLLTKSIPNRSIASIVTQINSLDRQIDGLQSYLTSIFSLFPHTSKLKCL